MKFGDKLILLRKKHGLSQEELASKLNVSRQSVSKWESNNTYPETDKIVQICNIFECRMDDLINDKINDVEQCERKNKNNLVIVFDSLLEFVTKSINMFTSMKFTSGLRCLIELGVLVICLLIAGLVISEFGTGIIMKLFGFLPDKVYFIFNNVIQGIIELVLICFSVIIVIHVFKIRYLDFYDKMLLNEKKTESEEVNNKEEKHEDSKKEKRLKFNISKEPKIIIRDKHTTFAFLTTLSKIIVGIFKAFISVIACLFVVSLIAVVALFVISISLSKYSSFFVGIDIGLVGVLIIISIILLLMIYFIINKKTNLPLICYIFLGSLFIIGTGVGICFIGLSGFKFLDNMEEIAGENVSKEIMIDVTSNMVIETYDTDGYTIRIDEGMSSDKVKVVGTNHEKYFDYVNNWVSSEYGMKIQSLHNSNHLDINTLIGMIYDDLENKIFRNYYIEDGTIEVVCNSEVAKMLISNAEKIYLVDYEKTDSGYKVNNYDQKIYLEYNCEMEYDARSGKYSYDDYCSCTKEVRMSPEGEIIDFDCKYISE